MQFLWGRKKGKMRKGKNVVAEEACGAVTMAEKEHTKVHGKKLKRARLSTRADKALNINLDNCSEEIGGGSVGVWSLKVRRHGDN